VAPGVTSSPQLGQEIIGAEEFASSGNYGRFQAI
jgi:hypothetical protein